jgi:ribosome-binding ATPase YchF (GTP1/OBG family)
MSLSVGIVGLPNAGKSTLFNALASRRLAETAPRPFTTIDPHEAVVALPDSNLERLRQIIEADSHGLKPSVVPATVTFIDIAGLVKGAHKGEGLGNQFLGKIREVDAIVHVVRAFSDPLVTHEPASPSQGGDASYELGSIDQILEDIEIVNIELELGGITKKPVIYVLNCDEEDLNNMEMIQKVEEKFKEKALLISAKLEEELIDFSEEERREYLKETGIDKTGLERLILYAYEMLGLITFYTIKPSSAKASEGQGVENQITARSLKNGKTALEAAAAVHTDFAKNFIKAEVVGVDKLLATSGWKEAKDEGLVGLEGKDYVVQDKDVIEFKVST